MNNDYSYTIEFWAKIFAEFKQVERVNSVFDANRLDIKIKGRNETLKATQEELDDSLYKFNSNPHEAVAYFLKKHGVLVYYQDTLVGFFDIQAYSEYINKTNIEQAIQKIGNFISRVRSSADTDALAVKIDHWILSDSVIIVVDTNRFPLFFGSLEVFFGACSMIMYDAITTGFPVRGAVGGGDFYKDGEMMVSSALVDAALYEKEQNWLGAVLTPMAVKLVEKAKAYEIKIKGKTNIDLSSDQFKPYIRYGAIPWKQNDHLIQKPSVQKPSEAYFIKPFNMADKDWAIKYLPLHFADKAKIDKSNCLYAEE
jgi:hypothetical protein